jgi:hypothetical protein
VNNLSLTPVRWEGKGMDRLERNWQRPLLGSDSINGLWAADLEGDGEVEIMVTSSGDYFRPADYFHLYHPENLK